jgi:hypothetical protein
MTSLEAMANKEGMQLTGIAPAGGTAATEATGAVVPAEGEQPATGLTEVTFDANLKGSYQGLQKFIADMENNRRPINVTKLSIVKEGEGAGSPSLNATISFTTYYSNQPS